MGSESGRERMGDSTGWLAVASFILSVANLLVLAIGGFIAVGRNQAALHKIDAALSQTELDLNRIELSVGETRANLNLTNSRLLVAANAAQLLSALQPKFDFVLDPEFNTDANSLELSFRLSNNGPYRLFVTPISLTLSKKLVLHESTPDPNLLVPITIEQWSSTVIQPNRSLGQTVTFSFKQEYPRTVYYKMLYEATIDPTISTFVKSILQEADIDMPEGITRTRQFRYGALVLPCRK